MSVAAENLAVQCTAGVKSCPTARFVDARPGLYAFRYAPRYVLYIPPSPRRVV